VGPVKVAEGLTDDQVLFLSDIFPTGYMAAEQAGIQPGDTVAVWGCGPVGLFTIKSAYLLGAEKVVAIDHYPTRLKMAEHECGAIPLNYEEEDVYWTLRDMTGGRGPDVCIDAVGLEAHGHSFDALLDYAKAATYLATDRPKVLRQAILACRKGGTVSIPGVYGGLVDHIPFGAAMNKGLTFKMGQTHVQRYMKPLMERIQKGEIDTTFLITHKLNLSEAARGYATFHQHPDDCVKVVMTP
jgi:threonine dehydrogenase-like Zn-dependent dehydrogenase